MQKLARNLFPILNIQTLFNKQNKRMKIKLFTLKIALLFLIISQFSKAQVSINSSGALPDANAVLDVSSSKQGVLLPRMTTLERLTLANVKGLTVYDTDTNSYWYFNNTAWVNLADVAGTSPWAISGHLISNTNLGNVGIGLPNPTAKLTVRGNTNTAVENTATFLNPAIGLNQSHIHYGITGDWYIRSAADAGKIILQDMPSAGGVGIGTSTPFAKLHVKNSTSNVPAIFEGFSNMFIPLMENGNYRGYIGSYLGNSEDVDFGTYTGNTTGSLHLATNVLPRLTVDPVGKIGIGTTTPQAILHVNPNGVGSILVGTNKTSGGYTNLEMGITAQTGGEGYVQSIGVAGSAWGSLLLNPYGGNVGVGTLTTTQKLTVAGNATISGGIDVGTNVTVAGNGIVRSVSSTQMKMKRASVAFTGTGFGVGASLTSGFFNFGEHFSSVTVSMGNCTSTGAVADGEWEKMMITPFDIDLVNDRCRFRVANTSNAPVTFNATWEVVLVGN